MTNMWDATIKYVVYFLLAIISLAYFLLRRHLTYFERRGIVYDKPHFIAGNMKGVGKIKDLRQPLNDFYKRYKNVAPLGGFYLLMRPVIVLFDLELIKTILIKDFAKFPNRGNYYNERDDPMSAHLFNLDGARWRQMRTKLTPTFTSGKMKFMFPTLIDVAVKFVSTLDEIIAKERQTDNAVQPCTETGIEIKDLLARFTTDIIGSCAFGLEVNSLRDPNSQFREKGKLVFTNRRHGRFGNAFIGAFPNLSRKLGIKLVRDDVSEFFLRIVRETVEQRERLGIHRNDFLNILMELRKVEGEEGLTMEQVAAQAFLFFLAGFETSSSTMGFCLYELAINQEIQEQMRAEINEMLERHDGKFTYEGIRELKYQQQVLHETLRKYSIAVLLPRKSVEDYNVPGTNFVIEKNTTVLIPIDAIHNDPDIYPNPEVFDPTRFEPEEVEKRNACSWIPFGEGPRNCIGLRFGEMQAMVGIAMLLKNFRFSPSKNTKIPIEIDPKSFILASKGGIVLNIERL